MKVRYGLIAFLLIFQIIGMGNVNAVQIFIFSDERLAELNEKSYINKKS